MDTQPYPYASITPGIIQRPIEKVAARRAVTIVPVELAIERGFAHKPRQRWNINGDIAVFGRSFIIFFAAAMTYFA